MRVCAELHGIEHKYQEEKNKIRFEFDLDNINDIQKLISYFKSPLELSEENSKILYFENEIKDYNLIIIMNI